MRPSNRRRLSRWEGVYDAGPSGPPVDRSRGKILTEERGGTDLDRPVAGGMTGASRSSSKIRVTRSGGYIVPFLVCIFFLFLFSLYRYRNFESSCSSAFAVRFSPCFFLGVIIPDCFLEVRLDHYVSLFVILSKKE